MEYYNGIAIYDHNNDEIYVNFPKVHKKNGKFINGSYKAAVRMFKRAKEYMLDKGILNNESRVPSYFIESLIYNVPNNLFKHNCEQVFYNIIDWLYNNQKTFSSLKCVNEE